MPIKDKLRKKEYQHEYYHANKEYLKVLQLGYIKNRPYWVKAYYYICGRCRAKGPYAKRGIKNLITQKELKELWERDKGYNLKRPSIDRINPKGNYELSNCRFIELSKNNYLASLLKKPIIKPFSLLRRNKAWLKNEVV